MIDVSRYDPAEGSSRRQHLKAVYPSLDAEVAWRRRKGGQSRFRVVPSKFDRGRYVELQEYAIRSNLGLGLCLGK